MKPRGAASDMSVLYLYQTLEVCVIYYSELFSGNYVSCSNFCKLRIALGRNNVWSFDISIQKAFTLNLHNGIVFKNFKVKQNGNLKKFEMYKIE